MSGGIACNCKERKTPIPQRKWVVLMRHCNYSAFNGYRRTPSDYSAITCLSCGRLWRTKARYVERLRNWKPSDDRILDAAKKRA